MMMLSNIDDNLLFANEEEIEKEHENVKFKVLIVDDDESIHTLTVLTLSRFQFERRGLEFIHAYSAKEAKEILSKNFDIAVMFLDVVMETDQSGLEVIKYLREVLGNNITRIILRTGQPGIAPEERIIEQYDINDYKTKTELTIQKLYTTLYSSLRSYRDIRTITQQKIGLEKVVAASANLYNYHSLEEFLNGLLLQLKSLLEYDSDAIMLRSAVQGAILLESSSKLAVVAGTGRYLKYIGKTLDEIDNEIDLKTLVKSFNGDNNSVKMENGKFIAHYMGQFSHSNYFFMEHNSKDINIDLLKLFLSNSSAVLDNYILNDKRFIEQKDIIFKLGEIIEGRDITLSNHIKRVSEITSLIAKKLSLDDNFVSNLEVASTLHDVGKISIPDEILNKPGKLTQNEFEIMKTHTEIGRRLFESQNSNLMKITENISVSHHEKWDGTGYPTGLKAERIPIEARIVSICDVFDALTHRRSYKNAWTYASTFEYIEDQKGKMFDPTLVDIFMENKEEIINILEMYPD
jgi:response regulator RpfG family c-di-GMP phosphodiesterase